MEPILLFNHLDPPSVSEAPEESLDLDDESHLVCVLQSLVILCKIIRLYVVRVDLALTTTGHCLTHEKYLNFKLLIKYS